MDNKSKAPLVDVGIALLPPAYVVRGKVIFILGNVCLFTIVGGTPSQVGGGGVTWGTPRPGLVLPRPEMGYPPT